MRQLATVIDMQYAVEQLLSSSMLLNHEVYFIQSYFSKSMQLQHMLNLLLAKPAAWLESILKTLICSQVEDARAIIRYIYVLLMEINNQLVKAACATFNNDNNDFELKHTTQVVLYEWFNIFNIHYTWNLQVNHVDDIVSTRSPKQASVPGK